MSCMFDVAGNHDSDDAFVEQMRGCCGSEAWCRAMLKLRPIANLTQFKEKADIAFDELSATDWLEAFACHPQIGDVQSLRMKYTGNDKWSRGEQSGISTASDETIEKLARGNEAYAQKFGYIFIVCATGKSAQEMLEMLEDRLQNNPNCELELSAAEQRKITHLRIEKLVAELSTSSD